MGNDSTQTTDSHDQRQRSLGKPVRFSEGRSTVEAVDIANKARRGTGKRKGFCALSIVDIRNAFNTARWDVCIEVMMRKKVPDYLMQMIDDYLSDRWLMFDGDKSALREEITCGAPQGMQVDPLVWNVMYDDSLRMDLLAGTSIIVFADDALVVCGADDVRILELSFNESLWRAER